MAISSHGGSDHLKKALTATCQNIIDDADEIIGNLDNVVSITVTIRFTPDSVVAYNVEREKYAHFYDTAREEEK